MTISCGIPQGSVLGPVLFILYTAPLSAVMYSHSVLHHSFANDTQLQKSASPEQENSSHYIKPWMTHNKLKLNDDETGALNISAPRISYFIPPLNSLIVGNSTVHFAQSAKYLGVTLDMHLTMTAYVVNLIQAANFELLHINSIRHYLSLQATKTLLSTLKS